MILKLISKKVFLLLIVLLCSRELYAFTDTQIKAVFLEKFTHLINWPENNNSEFSICVLNDKNFAKTLREVHKDKTHKSKAVIIISLSDKDPIPYCELLFIGANTRSATKITRKLSKKPILTVSDNKSFLKDNIMITMFLSQKRFKYILNNKAAKDADIKISYLLLRSAQEVIK